jgi:hypothetical protein
MFDRVGRDPGDHAFERLVRMPAERQMRPPNNASRHVKLLRHRSEIDPWFGLFPKDGLLQALRKACVCIAFLSFFLIDQSIKNNITARGGYAEAWNGAAKEAGSDRCYDLSDRRAWRA